MADPTWHDLPESPRTIDDTAPEERSVRTRRSETTPRQRRSTVSAGTRRSRGGRSAPRPGRGTEDPSASVSPSRRSRTDRASQAPVPMLPDTPLDPEPHVLASPAHAPVFPGEPPSVTESSSFEETTATGARRARRGAGASSGRRRRISRGRRQRARAKTSVVIAVLALLAVAGVAFVSGLVDRAIEIVNPTVAEPTAIETAGDRQPSVLLLTYDDADPSGRASGAIVLAHDRDTDQGTVLLVPSTTVADVPGYGSFQLGEAYALGGGPLVGVTLDNLLGVRIDGFATVSVQGWAVLLDRAGGFEIDVRSRLVAPADAGGGEVRFEAGPQFLDGPRLAEYLTFRQDSETELERLPRAQQVIGRLLDVIGDDPDALNRIFSDGAPMLGTTDPDLVRIVLDELAAARAADRLTTLTLPVSALGSGRDDVYRIDSGRVEQLVTERLAASIPTEGAGVGRGVQILNGNGVPRIGQQVAERLSDGGYRIVLTGNADRFTYDVTRILIYDGSDEQLALARDVQERLGVGMIERAGTPQSVVDVTIVVGADFPPD